MGAPDPAGLSRVKRMEQNNQPQGRSGGGTRKMDGVVGTVRHNPTQKGGINRPTRGN